MNLLFKKITIMSVALAGLISAEKGMSLDDTGGEGQINQPSAEPNQWYKNLEASILKGKACASEEIFRRKSGVICKIKDAAELYVLLCKKELGNSLLTTGCGKNAMRFGSDFLEGAVQHVTDSTKKGYTNLYWLVCRSKANTKNDAIKGIKAVACAPMAAAKAVAPVPTPQPTSSWSPVRPRASATTTGPAPMPEYLKPQAVVDITQRALINLPKKDFDTIMGLQNELHHLETLKNELRKVAEQGKKLHAVNKQVQQPVKQLGALPELAGAEAQAITTLIEINKELKASPTKLTPEQEAKIEQLVQEIEQQEKEVEEDGARINPTTGKAEFFDQEKRTWGPDLPTS